MLNFDILFILMIIIEKMIINVVSAKSYIKKN